LDIFLVYLTEVSTVSLNGILSESLNIALSFVQCSAIGPSLHILNGV